MKNLYSYVISGILAVALIVLYVLHFASNSSGKDASGNNMGAFSADSSATLPIAYVNVDSLLLNYNFAKDLNEALMRKEEGSRASLIQRQRQLQSAVEDFERKRQNNAFLSTDRELQERQRILKMQQDYEQVAQRLTQEFTLEQQKLNMEMEDTIKVRLKEFNKTRGYQMILSNTGTANILLADKKYDVTKDVIDFLNKKYGPQTSATTTPETKK